MSITLTAPDFGRIADPVPPAIEGSDPGVVIFVHGMEDHHSTWEPLLQSWSENGTGIDTTRDVLCLDMPWRRGSDYRWREQGTSGWWLRRALADIERPIRALIGHSFGANAVMTHLAGLHPAHPAIGYPRAAALIAPFFRPRTVPVDDAVRDRSRIGFTSIIAEGLALRLGTRRDTVGPEVLAAMTDGVFRRLSPLGFEVFFDSFVSSGELPLAGSRVPTLVIAGAGDEGLGLAHAGVLSTEMPSAALHLHADYGHFCHLERVDEVAAELHTFLSRTANRPTR